MKKYYYLVIISLIGVICYYIFQTNELNYEITSFKNLNAQLTSDVAKYEENNIKLSNENKILKNNEQIKQLEIKDEQIICNKTPITELVIDGSGIYSLNTDDFYLKYGNKTFIPSDFIEKYYNLENYGPGIVIRGAPYEESLIKIDGGYKLSEIHKLIDENKEKEVIEKKEEYYTAYKMDGLLIEYFEAGAVYTLTKSSYLTERGITVGSTRGEVKRAYGTLGKENDEEWQTFKGSAEGIHMYFTFKDNKVVKIVYRFQ